MSSHPCPIDAKKFHRLVNMSPKAILAWAKDPRAKCASFESTRRRLPHLAKLKAKDKTLWDKGDCNYARRVSSFNSRMQGMVDKWGCKPRALRALRNWGRMPPRCSMEDVNALGKDCRRRR